MWYFPMGSCENLREFPRTFIGAIEIPFLLGSPTYEVTLNRSFYNLNRHSQVIYVDLKCTNLFTIHQIS